MNLFFVGNGLTLSSVWMQIMQMELGDYWKWFGDNPALLHGNLAKLNFKFRILRHSMIIHRTVLQSSNAIFDTLLRDSIIIFQS